MLNQTQDSIFDQGKLADLKRQAGERSPEAIKAVAKQFESLFLQMMLKQMRQSMASGEGEGEQVGFYRGLADQQLASNLSKTGGIGLARSIEQQMARSMGVEMPDEPLKTVAQTGKVPLEMGLFNLRPLARVAPRIEDQDPAGSDAGAFAGGKSRNRDGANGFVDRIWSGAVSASRTLGVPAHFVVGQAALETGWGRSELRLPNGESAHNLFNIKAGGSWHGPVVEAVTTEYVGGVAQKRVERFRAYSSYAEAFRDYAKLIADSPRYAAVRGQNSAEGFAQALSQAGYASDPMYAQKLARIIGGATLRSALSG
ncbi:flagellar assembly peptidoglycan hydrolase FlgJ [Niveibacterium terrae]|uniref:flagellar assembly peptidoglycan hydrolase FlgJ n=1 Tax=Niveibacterium terrae TaxID=3373598 RepID=UPI003A93F658